VYGFEPLIDYCSCCSTTSSAAGMVYFHWTVEEFEEVWNPSNCEVWALEMLRRKVGPGRTIIDFTGKFTGNSY